MTVMTHEFLIDTFKFIKNLQEQMMTMISQIKQFHKAKKNCEQKHVKLSIWVTSPFTYAQTLN